MRRDNFDYTIAADCVRMELRRVGLSWSYINSAIESKYPAIGKKLPELFQEYSGLIDQINRFISLYGELRPVKRRKMYIAAKIRRAVKEELIN